VGKPLQSKIAHKREINKENIEKFNKKLEKEMKMLIGKGLI